MSQDRSAPDQHTILADAWGHVVGGMEWLRSVLFGEFADHRPLSAVVADMLVSFIPGVVIVTSARDAVAVILRLATHQEKREELMEWVLLCACLIVIALPVAMAAGSAVALGVGAVVGGVAGSELGAALRAVMLMLIKEASKLVELVRFLQKFMKGDILKFLRGVRFARYEKALIQAVSKIIGKLVEIVKALRIHLESLQYFDSVKTTVATLADWEKKFYNVQRDALKQVPKALAELDARLAKVLAQTAPKEVHTVAAGVQADKTVAALPAKQHVIDTPGNVFSKVESKVARVDPEAKARSQSVGKSKKRTPSGSRPKEKPDPVTSPAEGLNTKRQTIADARVTADRERIIQLSNEARDAERRGNEEIRKAKIEEARDIIRPHLPQGPEDTWDEVVKRLDVSSPKNGAVFWSGDPKAAQKFAEGIDGVTLETTAGGRIIDDWKEVNNGYNWDESYGPGPYARELWAEASEKYAEGAVGHVNTVQTTAKLWDERTLWHNTEKIIVQDKLQTREVSGLSMYAINNSGEYVPLGENYIKSLLQLKGRAPK
jgi:hypothetical protein